MSDQMVKLAAIPLDELIWDMIEASGDFAVCSMIETMNPGSGDPEGLTFARRAECNKNQLEVILAELRRRPVDEVVRRLEVVAETGWGILNKGR
jgi:hypothetical protein